MRGAKYCDGGLHFSKMQLLDFLTLPFSFTSPLPMDIQLGNIGNTIQLAIAPVFLLTGVGTNLAVLTSRLARIIDRSRVLEERIEVSPEGGHGDAHCELRVLYQRAILINRAITLSTACGLLVCVVIAALFIGGAANFNLGTFIAVCFVTAMFSLIGSFLYLLREIFVATRTLPMQRVGALPR